MLEKHQVIFIQPAAPSKPALGLPCNGCGVCCLLAPCPLGIVLSGRRQGACVAVRWSNVEQKYRCGALTEPVEFLKGVLPQFLWRMVPWLAKGLARLAKRWIAVGIGCDSSVELSTDGVVPNVSKSN